MSEEEKILKECWVKALALEEDISDEEWEEIKTEGELKLMIDGAIEAMNRWSAIEQERNYGTF